MARTDRTQEANIARGWSAADIDPSEFVDDDWITKNTRPGKPPLQVRHMASRLSQVVRLISGTLTRDQMRRIAARTGYPYVEAWSAHNKGAMRGVWGALCHHTGSTWALAGDYPTLRVVRDGRPGLENSLCMFGLGKSGTIYLVSEKLSWHAGEGEYNGITDGNGFMAGIEAESDGVNWTAAELDCYPRLVASILIEINQNTRYTTRHATYGLPRGRKTDFSGIDTAWFWRMVDDYLAHPDQINVRQSPTPESKDDDMPVIYQSSKGATIVNGNVATWFATNDELSATPAAAVPRVPVAASVHERILADLARESSAVTLVNVANGSGYCLLSGGTYAWLKDFATVESFRASGTPEVNISQVEHENWKLRFTWVEPDPQ